MTKFHRVAFATLALPLSLALAACGSEDAEGGAGAMPVGEPIPHIAAPEGETWTEVAVETPEGGFRIGNPDAPIKLVEYFSNTCHVCADFAKEGALPLDTYVNTGVVSYEMRNLVRDPVDLSIGLLARCGDPVIFHPLSNQVLTNFEAMMDEVQANSQAINQAIQSAPAETRFQAIGESSGILDFFAARGISRDQAMQCLADTSKAQSIAERSQQQGDELNITGTPTFFLNGARVDGTNWQRVEAALQNAGAR